MPYGMSPEDEKKWDAFVERSRKDAIAKIAGSALTVCLSPPRGPEDFDVQQAMEIGASILMDKPLLVIVGAGRQVSSALLRVADHVIELEHDLDLEAGQEEMRRKLLAVLDALGIGGR